MERSVMSGYVWGTSSKFPVRKHVAMWGKLVDKGGQMFWLQSRAVQWRVECDYKFSVGAK